MKKIGLLLLIGAGLTTAYRCTPSHEPGEPASFTYTIEEDSADFAGLPALQSFASGTTDSCWLLFGGRTNGFHGFGSDQNFPFKKANTFIYVYNTFTHVLDSMSVAALPVALREQYASTNMQSRQVDGFLYVCGGYGAVNAGQPDSNWITHNIISRINVRGMVNAVIAKDTPGLYHAIAYDSGDVVRATGGELYKLPDGRFYLVVGHNFTGQYSSPAATQLYLDAVHIFSLNETDSSIQLTGSVQYLSDNLNDTVTQFRRRDLVVSPNVLPGDVTYGISIYGGVFTYTSGCPSCNGGNPFRNPIYISGGTTPSYELDTAFSQLSNIYSAPNLQLYDSARHQMYTTIFGGLGDTALVNGDNASFTQLVVTLNRDNVLNKTSAIYNPSGMPAFVGAEGVFIKAANVPVYNNNNLGILDINGISGNGRQLLGYIYGGIYSNAPQWGNANPTYASGKVYKVWINKTN